MTGPDGQPVRVLIVDDHRVVAAGLALALGAQPGLEVVGVADSVRSAIEAGLKGRPDVVVCDFHLRDGSGADVARELRERLPGARVLMLSADVDDAAMLAAVDVGAAGYLEKTVDEARLAESVLRVAAGETLIPAATLARLLAEQRARQREQAARDLVAARFTPREREVLALVAEGLDSKTLASRLGISLSTARWHVQQVIEKLGAHSKLEAVARATALGLLDRPPVAPTSAGEATPQPAR